MPDGDPLRLPGLPWPDGDGVGGHEGNVAAAGGARVLDERERVQFDDARAERPVLVRGRRRVLIFSFAPHGVVEGPVLHLALARPA
jgi:hypothetical protein